jgi:hypothetical protein
LGGIADPLFVKAAVFLGGWEGRGARKANAFRQGECSRRGPLANGAAVAFQLASSSRGCLGRERGVRRGAIGFAQSTVVRRLEDW